MSEVFYIMELIGTIAFAVSGAFVATEEKMDILGVIMLGIVTAIGGGVIRDVLIGAVPPSGLVEPIYSLIAIIVSVIVFIPEIRKHINRDSKLFIFVDAVGLGTFTILGCIKALPFDNILFQLFLGVLSGVGGGVMRDLFATKKPTIFVKHFYALASLLGAVMFMIIQNYDIVIAMVSGLVVIVVLRMLAAIYKWHLPKAK